MSTSSVRINAGFFVLRREIFDYMNPGDELVVEPFERLVDQQRLVAYPYDGFWRAMDTFKDKVELDRIATADEPPWQVWGRNVRSSSVRPVGRWNAYGPIDRRSGSRWLLRRALAEAGTTESDLWSVPRSNTFPVEGKRAENWMRTR